MKCEHVFVLSQEDGSYPIAPLEEPSRRPPGVAMDPATGVVGPNAEPEDGLGTLVICGGGVYWVYMLLFLAWAMGAEERGEFSYPFLPHWWGDYVLLGSALVALALPFFGALRRTKRSLSCGGRRFRRSAVAAGVCGLGIVAHSGPLWLPKYRAPEVPYAHPPVATLDPRSSILLDIQTDQESVGGRYRVVAGELNVLVQDATGQWKSHLHRTDYIAAQGDDPFYNPPTYGFQSEDWGHGISVPFGAGLTSPVVVRLSTCLQGGKELRGRKAIAKVAAKYEYPTPAKGGFIVGRAAVSKEIAFRYPTVDEERSYHRWHTFSCSLLVLGQILGPLALILAGRVGLAGPTSASE